MSGTKNAESFFTRLIVVFPRKNDRSVTFYCNCIGFRRTAADMVRTNAQTVNIARMSSAVKADSFMAGANATYVEMMYDAWRKDPKR